MKFSAWILAGSLCLSSSFTLAASPTEASVQKLFDVMNLDKLTQDTMLQLKPQFATQAEQMVKMMVEDEHLDPKQQKVADQITEKMYQQSLKMISWKEMQPIYLKVYKDAYTQEEIQAQIDFYSSAIGQSILKKTPIVTEKTMSLMNGRIEQSIQTHTQDFVELFSQLEDNEK